MEFGDLFGFDFADWVEFADLLVQEGYVALVLWGHYLLLGGYHVETLVEGLQLTRVYLSSWS